MVCLQAEVDKIIHCENLKLTKIKLAINKKASPFSSEMTEEEKNYTKTTLKTSRTRIWS